MKKVLIALISMMLVFSLCVPSIAASATSEPVSNNSVYSENFESYEVGSNKNEEIFANRFMWFESAHHDTNIVDRNGSKAVEYSIIGDDGAGYSKLGGLGTGDGGNLCKMVNGVVYTVSMDIEILTENESSEFYIEYKKADWTGIKFVGGQNPVALNGNSTLDVKYENGRLEFSFVADNAYDGSGASYITFTAARFEIDDKIYIDNIEIKPYEYDFDYENCTTGSAATGAGSEIPNVWNGGDSSVIVAEKDGNKFLEVSHAATGADAWQVVYLNNLWNLKPGWTYRLSMDVLCNEYIELYLCYPHNSSPNATYSPSGYVGKSDSPNILGGSFDGSRLTYDFKPDTAVDPGFWAQICIVIKHNDAMKLQLDNITISHLHVPGEVEKENQVDSTCEKAGTYDNVAYCTECQMEVSRDTVVLDKLPHTEVVDAAVEATCKAAGKTEGKHCSVCEEVILAQEDIEKLPHTEVIDAAVEATCTTAGKTEGKHCSVCEEVILAQEDVPAGHKWTDATCTSPKTCSACDETEGEALEHTYDGETDKDCNVCGEEREISEPAATPWYVRIWEAIVAFFKRIFAFL